MLGVVNPLAPILVVGQNPGEIRVNDIDRQYWLHHFQNFPPSSSVFNYWYGWDFMTSMGHKLLCDVLGKDWLTCGVYSYTNAVRCRTKSNEHPSDEMITKCKSFTFKLAKGRKGLILMGRLAVEQVLGDKKFEWGIPIHLEGGAIILPIRHFSAWNYSDGSEIKKYLSAAKEMRNELCSDVTS